MFSPYDWNEAVRHRVEFIESRLRGGSPVVGVSADDGVLLLTVRGSQRKVFEIYDRLMFAGMGNQADLEAVRVSAIDFAHQEGFNRSADDVTIQRLVGFFISPVIKKGFGESFSSPFVLRAIFAELGRTPEKDEFFALNYDGEFQTARQRVVIGASQRAEERASAVLASLGDETPSRLQALDAGLRAWAAARRYATASEDEETPQEQALFETLAQELKTGTVEAGLLQRGTARENKFRILTAAELAPVVGPYVS